MKCNGSVRPESLTTTCVILDEDEVPSASDHLPVLATLNITNQQQAPSRNISDEQEWLAWHKINDDIIHSYQNELSSDMLPLLDRPLNNTSEIDEF